MITEQDLREAIAECEGTTKPNANTCIKLAAFYTILKEMKGSENVEPSPIYRTPQYSMAIGEPILRYSDSEFSQLTEDKGIEEVFPIIDELMDALMVMNPKLYDSVIRKIEDV